MTTRIQEYDSYTPTTIRIEESNAPKIAGGLLTTKIIDSSNTSLYATGQAFCLVANGRSFPYHSHETIKFFGSSGGADSYFQALAHELPSEEPEDEGEEEEEYEEEDSSYDHVF